MSTKTLIYGDTHLDNPTSEYMEAQISCLLDIYRKENPDKVIFLGDVYMHRKPTPSVLLGLRKLLDHMSCDVWILRGNHDAENKSDNGVTALSVFHRDNISVVSHTQTVNNWTFIPHYEDEKIIKTALRNVPEGNKVFGHFGYDSCLDTAGVYPSSIRLAEFRNPTYLGHIHRQSSNGFVEILGTPYTVHFGESGKQCYYGILEDEDFSLHEVDGGIRHLVYGLDDLERNKDVINDPSYHTLLRVCLNKLDESNQHNLASEIYKAYDVKKVDIKFNPIMDDKFEVSNYLPDRDLFSINEAIVGEYIQASNASIPEDELLMGYKLLYEDQQSRN